MTGIGKEMGDEYYLEETGEFSILAGHVFLVDGDHAMKMEKILLWHCCLGHPSFSYLEHLFPSLFSKVLLSSLHCEHCILAKNHRVTFKSSFI